MIANPGLHGGGNAERLMNLGEVVEHVMKRHGASMVVHLFTKGVCQPGKAPHVHPHR